MGISRTILRNENKILIDDQHIKAKYGLYTYLSEADRVRLCFSIFKRIKVIECKELEDAFAKEDLKKIDEKETLVDFLSRYTIITEVECLKSRSQAVMRLNNFVTGSGAQNSDNGLIWKQASLNIFIDQEVIRDFYGE